MRNAQFADRKEAGSQLARRLSHYDRIPDATVLGLPRGGAVVAAEVARILDLPLDVFTVRKLGVPGREELALGAIASGGIRVLRPDVITHYEIGDDTVESVAAREEDELRRRERLYREGEAPLIIEGRTVIVVDDGLATGSTMRAAVRALRRHGPRRIVVAVPVGAPEVVETFQREADEVVCTITPAHLTAVGAWYENFDQVDDADVIAALRPFRQTHLPGSRRAP